MLKPHLFTEKSRNIFRVIEEKKRLHREKLIIHEEMNGISSAKNMQLFLPKKPNFAAPTYICLIQENIFWYSTEEISPFKVKPPV